MGPQQLNGQKSIYLFGQFNPFQVMIEHRSSYSMEILLFSIKYVYTGLVYRSIYNTKFCSNQVVHNSNFCAVFDLNLILIAATGPMANYLRNVKYKRDVT